MPTPVRYAERPGPHPENQRKRAELRGPRRTLIGVLAVVAVLGLVAAVRGPAEGDAHATYVPLLFVLAVSQAVACVLVMMHQLHARKVALAAAGFAIACGAGQIMVWDAVTWLQLSLLGVGAFEALLVAGCTPRDGAARAHALGARGRPLNAHIRPS